MQALFWTTVGFVLYTYAGYPVLVWLLARLRREGGADPAGVAQWPEVTIVMATYNEHGRLARKLENLRALDYPAGKLQVLVVCDGSSDGSAAFLATQTDVRAVVYTQRRGKPHALNRALEQVRTPVVVFADVRQQIDPQAVRLLVARLLQPGIGAVSGELVHVDPGTHAAANIGLYWRYEKWIRKSEGRLASTCGVTGALYAIRREDYTPLPDDTLLDDFAQPMAILRRGKRVVFESRAVMFDELQQDVEGEKKRKVRTLTGNFQAFFRAPWLFVPGLNPVWLQFLSHKVFRLLVPYALALMLLASLLAGGAFYTLAAATQIAFYLLVLAARRLAPLRRNRLVSFALVFVELNWAAVLGLRNYLLGQADAKWEKT